MEASGTGSRWQKVSDSRTFSAKIFKPKRAPLRFSSPGVGEYVPLVHNEQLIKLTAPAVEHTDTTELKSISMQTELIQT